MDSICEIEVLDTIAAAIITTVVGAIALFFQRRHQNFQEQAKKDEVFKELFTEYNDWYDSLNNCLYYMRGKRLEELNDTEKGDLYDYLNLCAEEYMWFKRKWIPPEIWNAWHHGMQYWINHENNKIPALTTLWENEREKEYKSYYLEKGEDFFDKGKWSKKAKKLAKIK